MICKFELFTLAANKDKEEEYLLTQVAEMVGSSYPAAMIEQSPARTKYFDDNSEFRKVCPSRASNITHIGSDELRFKSTAPEEDTPDTLEYLVQLCNAELSAFEISDLLRFLKRCLQLDPDDRATIDELLEDLWLCV
jgi:serine/threonine protein kinase